jgi:hypothetical protein
MADRVPASLQAALADVMKWLDASHIPSMVIGGVASSMLGRARLTQDVDALVLLPEGSGPTRCRVQTITALFRE